jgi:hypothetical protein
MSDISGVERAIIDNLWGAGSEGKGEPGRLPAL